MLLPDHHSAGVVQRERLAGVLVSVQSQSDLEAGLLEPLAQAASPTEQVGNSQRSVRGVHMGAHYRRGMTSSMFCAESRLRHAP